MTGPGTQSIEAAANQAEHYANLARTGGVGLLWDSADTSLQQLSDRGFAPEEFLPPEERIDLGFNVPGVARAFYRAYIKVVRQSLCSEKGELRSQLKTALSSGVGTGITLLASALAIPAAAAILLAPVIGIMLALGVDAFCEAPEVEP
jgi:hypothetical protein